MDPKLARVLVTACTIEFALTCLVIVIAVKGEKRMIRDNFIKGFFFWPDVSGDRVPVVARRYKLMAITFACSMFIFSLFCTLAIFYM